MTQTRDRLACSAKPISFDPVADAIKLKHAPPTPQQTDEL